MYVIEKLAAFADKTRGMALPEEVVNEVKRLLLDSLACSYAALTVHKGKLALRAGQASGTPEATVFGGGKLSLASAAFVNGELINAIDFDACLIPPGHITPYVLPSILALAESTHADGQSVIAALAVAHEVSVRFGRSTTNYRDVTPGQKNAFPPVSGFSCAALGGTLGASQLLKLDAGIMASAVGLAGRMAPAQSLSQWARSRPATDDKYLLSGWMSQTILQAVHLAECGYRGDLGLLDGDHGFFRFMGISKWDTNVMVSGLGDEWQFPKWTIYKPYPTCRISQTALQCLEILIRENNLRPDEIDHVKVQCDPHAASLPLWYSREIESEIEAQMNVPYAVAMVALGFKSGPEWHDDAAMNDPRVREFMQRVTVASHPHFEEVLKEDSQARIGSAEVHARGKRFTHELRYRKGSPATDASRMTDDELTDKFHHCASRVLSQERARRVADTVWNLEKLQDLTRLAQIW
ncbi:hypothetical protein CAL18_01940 [Bordetella genomosp. 7]|uniref:MmgE/PrpD family protein n=1 Tax=Bordetella genomosp. 7 TaxID=1416805 RepID=UPI000B9E4169|nr:MmgE/PrpD family protein [Bordetella genomosp. 7]OZI28647.1 hypothetical protein CAL18_01940 [Bordetella genomosp. 7]